MARKRLVELAFARSGDKGNNVNIGVIARDPSHFDRLKQVLTAERVAEFFASEFDRPSERRVEVFELPGISALNFVLYDCLGGGGAYSLRIDSQGKAFAQRLLQLELDGFGEGEGSA